MRICIYNNCIIEMQSDATEGTLLANANAAGIICAVEKEVTAAEYKALLAAQPLTIEESNASIKAQITLLDSKRIRPLAEGDPVYLAKLNEKIVALRAQLK